MSCTVDDNMAAGKSDIVSLIAKKRDGGTWTKEDIKYVVNEVCNKKKTIQDSQIGALLMAIRLKGMDPKETIQLTNSMIQSGEALNELWPDTWRHLVVDKHSTGGVGDKISLVLAPALAACGLKVPMISGRGLGHTGGTLDKLESIPGYNVTQSKENIRQILEDVGCCIVGQTEDLVPADRIFYTIRDVTATVDSIPLIVGSIISKKAAEGLKALVLDIKVGKGAVSTDESFMKELAVEMVQTGNGLEIKTTGFLTRMDNPLGKMIGNALEVAETIECLRGNGHVAIVELATKQGGQLVFDAKLSASPEEGAAKIAHALKDGSALEKFRQMLKSQGVASKVADDLCSKDQDVFEILPKATHTADVTSLESGYLREIDSLVCAEVCKELGAGRTTAGQKLDMTVGLEIKRNVGDSVKKGDVVMTLHHNGKAGSSQLERLQKSLSISADPFTPVDLIVEIIVGD